MKTVSGHIQKLRFELAVRNALGSQGWDVLVLGAAFGKLVQLLLVQDGKLYGWEPMFSMLTRVAGLPEVTQNHDIQKNDFMVQLG
ncbi:hypothetical protein Fmac_008271 [Flemingia macrophylla]|uniref:NAA35-like TPR repeats domain-containing protein n=1 Tax=Flemingia macrophylla TaxID=520843 RepID=A0ABD1MWX1_9FABA